MLLPLSTAQTRFTGGVLQHRTGLNIDNLFSRIDVGALTRVYAETHDPGYAEPEFCGKWLDTAMQVYGTTGEGAVLTRAADLVRVIGAGQRRDGYLGTYHCGSEFESFSVWNHQFTVMGLLSYYEVTGHEEALACARRGGDFLVGAYLGAGAPDLLDAINQGIENSCALLQMARLASLTGESRYLDFCAFVVDRWESSTLRLVSAPHRYDDPTFHLGCLKAAEMLICYQGLVALFQATGVRDYLTAAIRYWEAIRRRQIGITGNGSVFEYWTLSGNRTTVLPADAHPNENCVAVCWMKLSALLFAATGEARFADAFEQTLYNHLLGAQARDGRDFSYYQAVEGRKVHVTIPGAYSCCRYRGLNVLAHLPRWVALEAGEGLVLSIYGDSVSRTEFAGVPVTLEQRSDYPREGRVSITVQPARAVRFVLSLRVPAWSTRAALAMDGADLAVSPVDGYVRLDREWSAAATRLELTLDLPVRMVEGSVEGRPVGALVRGPLVLAADSRDGDIDRLRLGPEPPALRAVPRDDPAFPVARLDTTDGVTLVDYASAGSADPTHDRFRVWFSKD